MKTLGAVLMALAFASPAAAQSRPTCSHEPDLVHPALRTVATGEQFTARRRSRRSSANPEQPFLGGGVEIAMRHGFYADVTVSQFSKTGQRSFVFNGRELPLGIPLTDDVPNRGDRRLSAPDVGRASANVSHHVGGGSARPHAKGSVRVLGPGGSHRPHPAHGIPGSLGWWPRRAVG